MAAESLDASKADRKIWLVKVPHFVAQAWKKLSDASRAAASEDLEADGPESLLGRIEMRVNNAQGSTEIFLDLPDGPETERLPKRFKMEAITDTVDINVMSVQSDASGQLGPRIEGVIDHRFSLAPVSSGSGEKVVVDPLYASYSRQRTEKSMEKTRQVKLVEINRDTKIELMDITAGRPLSKQGNEGRQAKTEAKRTRMDKDDLEKALFRLFEQRPHWTFFQIQKETNQPGPWLKEVLGELAIFNKRGPHKDLYELKREYKQAPAAPEPG